MPVPPGATAGIVEKRATGSRISGNQGETKKVKPPNGLNPRTRPNKPKKLTTIMISPLPAQTPVQWQSLQMIGLPTWWQ